MGALLVAWTMTLPYCYLLSRTKLHPSFPEFPKPEDFVQRALAVRLSAVYHISQHSSFNLNPTSTLVLPLTLTMNGATDPDRDHALEQYKTKLLESREWEAKLKALRLDIKGLQHDFDTTEDNIKALQSVGQIIGEVLKQLDEERCK